MGQPHPELTRVSHRDHLEQNHENPGSLGWRESLARRKEMIRVVISLGDTIRVYHSSNG